MRKSFFSQTLLNISQNSDVINVLQLTSDLSTIGFPGLRMNTSWIWWKLLTWSWHWCSLFLNWCFQRKTTRMHVFKQPSISIYNTITSLAHENAMSQLSFCGWISHLSYLLQSSKLYDYIDTTPLIPSIVASTPGAFLNNIQFMGRHLEFEWSTTRYGSWLAAYCGNFL